MKDVYQIFDESLNTIRQFIEAYKFDNCTTIASELIHVTSMADYKDGIFISEILETIFSNISSLFGSYEINDDDRKLIKEQLKDQMGLLLKSYRDEDKAKIYHIVRDMRSMATQFQFKCWNMMTEKSEPEIKRFVRRQM
ncbi:MAG: hypothetical protein ACRD92_08950 [Nitrosopumilaceae archaeon]